MPERPNLKPSETGFTLIEVMVALVVIALALPALLLSLYQQIDGTQYLRDKSLAQMIAVNKWAELRLLSQYRGQIPENKEQGVEEMAGRHWLWRISSARTQMQSFRQVQIDVYPEGDQADSNELIGRNASALYTLTTYMPVHTTTNTTTGTPDGDTGEAN
ncbi:MAG: type II secretion system minor pseudopilin GspI [Parahaliea sp.]